MKRSQLFPVCSAWITRHRAVLGLVSAIAWGGAIALQHSMQPSYAQTPALRGELAFTLEGLGGAEMLSVSRDGQYAAVAGGDSLTLVRIGSDTLDIVATQTLAAEYLPNGSTAAEFTGLAISPDGAYVLVAVKDNDDANLATFDEVPGKVVAYSLPDLQPIGQVAVGRGPDSVAIAPNGQFAAIANEDEENEEDLTNLENRPGSISVIDLRNGPGRMTQVEVAIPADNIPFFAHDPQPETVRISADSRTIFATLQENNAIARIDLPARLPRRPNPAVFRVQNFDAGIRTNVGLTQDRVGEGACRSSAYTPSLMQEFTSAREPDGLAIAANGRYLITADEDNLTAVNNQAVDGKALSPHGTRTISVFDAQTGELLGDSGSSIEEAVIAAGLPMRCNAKGPEPEVVSVGEVNGRTLAFVALERADAISIHDVTDPANIQLVDLVVLNPNVVKSDRAAELEPEGIEFVFARNQVVVSNPEGGSMSLINLVAGE
ncbi:choice-of-anchor I domain-containing protein [Leptolyngbya sp. AN02str]|uniref:choice-of-anchor I domain-containing protein n=1 Tax=Leptolyngbya sp. AN02str TaxID=3423363 RepID=UPI003D31B932